LCSAISRSLPAATVVPCFLAMSLVALPPKHFRQTFMKIDSLTLTTFATAKPYSPVTFALVVRRGQTSKHSFEELVIPALECDLESRNVAVTTDSVLFQPPFLDSPHTWSVTFMKCRLIFPAITVLLLSSTGILAQQDSSESSADIAFWVAYWGQPRVVLFGPEQEAFNNNVDEIMFPWNDHGMTMTSLRTRTSWTTTSNG